MDANCGAAEIVQLNNSRADTQNSTSCLTDLTSGSLAGGMQSAFLQIDISLQYD
jgi:hypothetical protein